MKKKFIYFFLLSIFLFFFYITIDFKTPIVTNKDAELASCNNLDYEQSQFIHPLNFKKFNIDLKIHEIRKWFRINLEDGVKSKKIGSFTNRKRVMGTMTFEIDKNIKCYLNVSIRAHGDQRDHRQGSGLQSLKVKILKCHSDGLWDYPYKFNFLDFKFYKIFILLVIQIITGKLLINKFDGETLIFLLKKNI